MLMVNTLEEIACSDINSDRIGLVCFMLTCWVELKCLCICKSSTDQTPSSRAPGPTLPGWALCPYLPPCVGQLCVAIARDTQLGKGRGLSWLTVLEVSTRGCFGVCGESVVEPSNSPHGSQVVQKRGRPASHKSVLFDDMAQ